MRDFREGFDRVLVAVTAQHQERTGSPRGAMRWLAKQLKTSPQNVDNWRKRNGFPYRYARKLCQITGLSEADIWPGGVSVDIAFPPELWNDVVRAAEDIGRSPPDTAVELVRIGLKSRSKS